MPPLEAIAKIRLAREDGTHEVPADVLVRSLAGLQQLVYLIAAEQEQRRMDRRFRVSQEIQQRYTLRCQIAEPGSYVVPLTLGGTEIQLSALTSYETILEKVENLLDAIQANQLDRLFELFPDGKVRNRALLEVRRLLPKSGELWRLGFQRSQHSEVLLAAESAVPLIDRALNQNAPEETVMTVTGELIRIDFDNRTVVLRYPPTRKEIECVYVDELEETMIENRRGLIQATGQFTLDAEGNPIKLTDVTRLEPIDLSPITFKTVIWMERQFKFAHPLTLNPYLDEDTQQLLIVEEPEISLHAFAQTREQLVQEIAEQIAFMWDAYVNPSPRELAPDALRLRHTLVQKVIEE